MRKLTRTLLPLALGAGLAAGAALAQTAPTPAPGQAPPPPKRERPSPETMQRMLDGRIAMITTALKLSDDQKKLWAPVEAKMRENQAARAKRMEQMGAGRGPGAPGAARPDMVERMERMNKMMTERTERSNAFLAVFKPFYASLTDEQKKVVGPLMMAGMGGGRGGHGGMMHRRGMHMGMGGPGQMPQ